MNLPEPMIEENAGGVQITFFKALSIKNVPENVTDKKMNRSIEILSILSKDKKILSDSLAQKLQVTKRTILRDLQALKTENKIRRIGSEKSGMWEVMKNCDR
jgi:ATP-dependent DNA helicase RecG